MDDQRREEMPLEAAQAWDSARRVREPVAWTLLVLTAIGVLISAWELLGLPGAPVIAFAGRLSAPAFEFRASAVAPEFVALGVVALPVLAVILVAFTGALTDRARQVVQAAVSIQAVALGLGVLSWLGALGVNSLPGVWFIADARELAIAAAGLVFTVAVRRSQALRSPTPQFDDFPEDDEDFDEEEEEED